jgi:hypothetical protein
LSHHKEGKPLSTSHCPNCGTVVHYGFTSCPGCRAALEYGAPPWTAAVWLALGAGVGVGTGSWIAFIGVTLCGALTTAHVMRQHIRAARVSAAPSRI